MAVVLLLGLVGCNLKPPVSTATIPVPSEAATEIPASQVPETTALITPTPPPTRLLTICLGREPASLFYYDATSAAAQAVLSAVYDGPVDIRNYEAYPVILEKMPSLADGSVTLRPVEVAPGDLVVDGSGNPVNLAEGVRYRPSGCPEAACSIAYTGSQPVQVDQLVVQFKLLAGLQWSDGAPLTAADSVYSFEIARSLQASGPSTVISRTVSYTAQDETTVEWVGVPGYQDGSYQTKFFTPLPQHAWSANSVEELRTADISSRKPVGWGPYVLDEWVSGDHISLHKNPLYFRAAENLPHFDNLVFRFISSGSEALDALQVGECDLVDRTAMLETQVTRLGELQAAGKARVVYLDDAGWEQITFGIAPLDSSRAQFFAVKEVRQAVALCIDRKTLAASQPQGQQLLVDSYVASSNPLHNPGVRQYGYDPAEASSLLEAAGWIDADNDPATPRVAQGVQGVADGTPFEVDYLVSPDAGQQADALAIQETLKGCGIGTRIITQDAQQYLAPGPEGPVFGRAFDLAQFAWASALEPPCYLYLTSEIPGPYPDYSMGWGGANASGYTSPEYDRACQTALWSLPDSPLHHTGHDQAQEIFSQDLPALPLYVHFSVMALRPDMCPVQSTSAIDSTLWDLELFDYGSGCTE